MGWQFMAAIGRRGGALRRIEWPTVGLIALCYGAWAGAGYWLWPEWPLAALAVLTLAVAFHSSLVHEVLHGHPTRDARLNEALVFFPIGLFVPYRRFKAMHLRHHRDERLTDPFDDPESYYKALWQYERYPAWFRGLLEINNTLIGRMILGPPLGIVAFLVSDWRAIRSGDRIVARAWVLHLLGVVPVVLVIVAGFGMAFWLYLLVPAWAGQSLISIRSFAEHQWAERVDGRTIIVERSLLSLLFLNNNLHLVHHKYPMLPWYRLPRLYRAERQRWAELNGGYIFPNYLLIFLSFALKKKEPVTHPVLRLEPEMPQAAEPLTRSRMVP
jgi:fatty acid desaturase